MKINRMQLEQLRKQYNNAVNTALEKEQQQLEEKNKSKISKIEKQIEAYENLISKLRKDRRKLEGNYLLYTTYSYDPVWEALALKLVFAENFEQVTTALQEAANQTINNKRFNHES